MLHDINCLMWLSFIFQIIISNPFKIKVINSLFKHFLQGLPGHGFGGKVFISQYVLMNELHAYMHDWMSFSYCDWIVTWHFSWLSDFLLDNYCTDDFSISQPPFKKFREQDDCLIVKTSFLFLRKPSLLLSSTCAWESALSH